MNCPTLSGVSRQRELFILAANYLQSLDWRNDPEIMQNIIGFYNKAKAMDSLANFYDACSQVEIDEYQNYEKALGALKEALKYMTKAKVADKDAKVAGLQQRIFLIERFVKARKVAQTEPEEMIKTCRQLLEEPDAETAIRLGDVFSMIVGHYFDVQDFEQAYNFVEKMREHHISISYYLEPEMVETIYQRMGVQIQPGMLDGQSYHHPHGGEFNPEVGEELDEEIEGTS